MTLTRYKASSVRGFTLMELLLAILIFAIVLAAIQTVFYSALRLRNATSQAIEASLPTQQALMIIKRDLSNLVLPGTNGLFAGTLQTSATSSGMNSGVTGNSGGFGTIGGGITFGSLAGQSSSVNGLPYPQFYTASGTIGDIAPWGDIQRVIYYLAEPQANTIGKDLIRGVSRNLLPIAEEEVSEQFLMSGVEDFSFQFFDGLQWLDVWDSTADATNVVPRAIKVTISMAQDYSARSTLMPIELIVPIDVQSPTNNTSMVTSTATGL